MSVISWSKSECKDGYLHQYQIITQDSNAVVEMCKLCKDMQVFKIVNGKVDNINYLKYHLRNALPPFHRLFKREFPNAK